MSAPLAPHPDTRPTESTRSRPSRAARRFGCLLAAALNLVLLYLVNVSPGWDAVPFLTDDTTRVLGLLNVSIVLQVVVQLVYAAQDARWLRALGDAVTTAVSIAVLVRVWQVFPFDLSDTWTLVFRVLLALGVVGCVAGMVDALVRLARSGSAR